MEQLTPRDWLVEQVRRAPSFAAGVGLIGAILILSAFVQYSQGRASDDLGIIEAGPPPGRELDLEIDDLRSVLEKFRPEDPPKWDALAPPPPPSDLEVESTGTENEGERGIQGDPNGKGSGPEGPAELPGFDYAGSGVDLTNEPRTPTVLIGTTPTWPPGGGGPGTGGVGPGDKIKYIRGEKRPTTVPPQTLAAILRGLRWLKSAQETDGSWTVARWGGSRNDAVCGVTGLALFALEAYGCSDRHPREFKDTVRTGLEFLLSKQVAEGTNRGSFGEQMYSQAICTMVLSEASFLVESPALRKRARDAAQLGLDYILSKQPACGGFGYDGAGNDVSVTGWQIMAMKSCILAGLKVPEDARERTENFLRLCMARDGSTPYRFNPDGGAVPGTPRMTAVGLASRLFMGHKRTAKDTLAQAEWLTRDDAHVKIARQGTDEYYIYYMCLGMYQLGGERWKTWNAAFNSPLRARQVQDGPDSGSWPVEGSAYGAHGGRVYTTAMACLALEVYFIYPQLYRDF